MECGLQTGLAYFSVFKFNPPVMMGSVQYADAVPACFHRNHYSEAGEPQCVWDGLQMIAVNQTASSHLSKCI